MHPQSSAPLLTKKQAAAYLGIAPRTIDDWRQSKSVACIERPGYVRFLKSDLDDFIARHRVAPKNASKFRPRIKRQSKNAATQVH